MKYFYLINIFLLLNILSFAQRKYDALSIGVKRPAKLDLKEYEKIAVGDILDASNRLTQNSLDISNEIETKLVNNKDFTVLDRQHLKSIMAEHRIQNLDETTAAELGKFIGSAVLIFGRIQTGDYDEKLTYKQGLFVLNGVQQYNHTRKGVYTLNVNIKFVDVQTAKILASETLTSSYYLVKTASGGYRAKPEKIDTEHLYRLCLTEIAKKFMQLVSNYEEKIFIEFLKHRKLKKTKNAMDLFQIGEWSEGLSKMERMTQQSGLNSKIRAKAFYNYGIALMCTENYDKSIENLKKAFRLHDEELYKNAIITAKKEKLNAEVLSKQ